MTTDEELLRLYAGHHDEDAFRTMVERYAGMVLSVAQRRMGDAAAAQDVAQQVFTLLARKAAGFYHGGHRQLPAWLHRTTLFTAGNALRSARRREHYHRMLAEDMKAMHAAPADNEAPWTMALPHIDEAIDSLSAADREVVLAHYFQRRTFRDLAAAAGKTDHAMQKRALRALEKLSAFLRRRGVVMSAAALAGGLSATTAEASPGFAAVAAQTALNSAPGLNTASVFANTLATMSMTKLTTAAAALAFLFPLGWQWRENSRAAAAPATAVVVNTSRAATGSETVRAASKRSAAAAVPDTSSLGVLAAEIAQLNASRDVVQLLKVKRLILELGAEELRGAFDLVKSVRRGDALELSRTVFARWGEVAPREGLAVARLPETRAWREGQLGSGGDTVLNTLGLFESWVLHDAAGALAAAQEWDAEMPRDGRHRGEIPEMLVSLATRDPARAQEMAATLTDESVREPVTRVIQEAWAQRDPEAALRWISEHAPDETRPRDLAWLLRSITASQPDRALALAQTLENPHARAEAMDFALHNWAVDQPRAALEAMLRLPAEVLTPHIVEHATIFLAGEDHATTAAAAERFPAGELRDIYVEVVARCWPGADRTPVLEWLNRVDISETAREKIRAATLRR